MELPDRGRVHLVARRGRQVLLHLGTCELLEFPPEPRLALAFDADGFAYMTGGAEDPQWAGDLFAKKIVQQEGLGFVMVDGGIMHLHAGCMLATQRTASQLLDRRRGEEFDSVRFQVGNARPQLRMVGVVVYVEDARLC